MPSPKSQNRLVIVPAELSVKLTVNGQNPLVGLARKLACGIVAPAPVTGLVELPSLAVRKTTLLLKNPSATGANWITTLVEPPSLLLKNAEPLKLPACVGVKATCTNPVWLMFKLKGLPLTTLKGAAA